MWAWLMGGHPLLGTWAEGPVSTGEKGELREAWAVLQHSSLRPNARVTGSVLRMWRMSPGSEAYRFFFLKAVEPFCQHISVDSRAVRSGKDGQQGWGGRGCGQGPSVLLEGSAGHPKAGAGSCLYMAGQGPAPEAVGWVPRRLGPGRGVGACGLGQVLPLGPFSGLWSRRQ